MTADTLPAGLVDSVQRWLAEQGVPPTPAELARAVRASSRSLVSDTEMLRLIERLQDELVGAGPLEELLAHPDTTDVVVNGPDDVRVDRGKGWEPTGITFADDLAVQRLARRLAGSVQRRLDQASPYVDGRLRDGTRLHAILSPIAAGGTCISLRVLRPARFDLAQLVTHGALPGVTAPVLRSVIAGRCAGLVAGGTGAGKTTLLAAVLGEVPADERVIVVEDAPELAPVHPHTVCLTARPPNVEGAGTVDLRALVRQALRMRPDRLVVGEVRGAEIADLLTALNTGHEGGWGTIHANSAVDVPHRVEALAAMGGMSSPAARAQFAGAIDVIVQVRRGPSGRQVDQIAVVQRDREGNPQIENAVLAGALVDPGADILRERVQRTGVAVPW